MGGYGAFWLARWPTFPVLLDPYYHLHVARQVLEAGGPMTYEWWEHAPAGRPHLYPPLLHLLVAGLLGLGCPALTALRLVTVVLVPCVMLGLYLTMRALIGREEALASLLLALVPLSWLLELAESWAAGLAALWFMVLLVSVERRRWLATACLLALLFYTHLGMPWVAVAGLLTAVVLKAIPHRRPLVQAMIAGVALGLPWLGHLLAHAGMLHVVPRAENRILELAPLLSAFGLIGAWHGWREGGAKRLLLALWVGSCVMAYPFTFRWVSGEGLLPVILLAGCGVGATARWVSHRIGRLGSTWAWIGLIGGLVIFSPTLVLEGRAARLVWRDSALLHLVGLGTPQRDLSALQLASPHMEGLARSVASLSRPREILWANATYAGGQLAALAQRPLSIGMFYEVPAAQPFDPIAAARWIVWFKLPPPPDGPHLEDVIRRYRLERIAEHPLALIFRHSAGRQMARRPEAVIPWWAAFVLSCGLLGASVWDLRRTQRPL